MRFYLSLVCCSLSLFALSQEYMPFPTDSAQWNGLTVYSNSPNSTSYHNYQYRMEGDTNINELSYQKVYHYAESDNAETTYLGGLREDSSKNIYFFPDAIGVGFGGPYFPNDTAEYLLYTFNDLAIGSSVVLNPNNPPTQILAIDSVLIGESYRKRYLVDNGNLLDVSHWIEGIGGTKDLFQPYSHEFEWTLYTLCFTDSVTEFISSPNGADSCHYWLSSSVQEIDIPDWSISPNPVSSVARLESNRSLNNKWIAIYNTQGILQKRIFLSNGENQINMSDLEVGLYFILLEGEDRKSLRFLKE